MTDLETFSLSLLRFLMRHNIPADGAVVKIEFPSPAHQQAAIRARNFDHAAHQLSAPAPWGPECEICGLKIEFTHRGPNRAYMTRMMPVASTSPPKGEDRC